MSAAQSVFTLSDKFVQLDRAHKAILWDADAAQRGEHGANGEDDVLVGVLAMDGTWPVWERHCAGDEIVTLISGRLDFVVELPDGDQTVSLRAGESCVVPEGTWHRAVIHEPCQALHITPMGRTEHRPWNGAGKGSA